MKLLRILALPLRSIAIQKNTESEKPTLSILDIGTGTGLLSLMVAQKNKVTVEAIEIDKDAAEQAVENVNRSPWADRIHVIHKDILRFEPDNKYDYVISNPPFYENELEGPRRERNMAHHSGGLLLSQLFKVISKNLAPEGKFFLILPYKRIAEAGELFNSSGLYIQKKVLVRTSVNHQATRVMVMGGKEKKEMIESVMEIKTGDVYSNNFIDLLKDYYLHL